MRKGGEIYIAGLKLLKQSSAERVRERAAFVTVTFENAKKKSPTPREYTINLPRRVA